jgi:O-antigen ligase
MAGPRASALRRAPGALRVPQIPLTGWYLIPWGFGAITVGALAGAQPSLALMGVIGLLVAGLVLWNLTAGLCVFVIVAHLEALPRLGGAVSLAKVVGLLLVASWLLATVMRQRPRVSLRSTRSGGTALLIAFIAWLAITLLWADDLDVGKEALPRYALNVALFPIVAAAIRERRHVLAFLTVMVAGATLSAAYGIIFGAEEEGRIKGVGMNANALGLMLIFGCVMATTLALDRSLRGIARVAAGLAALFGTYALLVTLSRGALVGTAVALVAAIVVARPGRRARMMSLVVIAAGCAIIYFAAFAPAAARERVSEPGDGSGRVDIWQVGWRMAEANPVGGVGVGNFSTSAVRYLLEPGVLRRSEEIVDDQKVTHNVYLQVLTETGAVGLGLYLGIFLFSLGCAATAARRFERMRRYEMSLIARGVIVAIVGVLAASFFSSQVFLKPLWLMLAFCPALLAMARSADRWPSPARR